MKVLFLFLALFSSSAFANEIVDETRETLQKYGSCNGPDYSKNDFKKFVKMLDAYEAQDNAGKLSPLEVTDFGFFSTTIKDMSSGTECTLFTDVYDGRCSYAQCD